MCDSFGEVRRQLTNGFVVTMILVSAACGSDGPTGPTNHFAGEWRGTTSQGQQISFTVSSDNRLVRLSVGYAFAICQGRETFDNLDVAIDSSNPSRAAGFTLGAPVSVGTNSLFVLAALSRDGLTASGNATFRNYPGCADSNATWGATR